jgi:hypothetical protein
MHISLEEALLLLNSWRNQGTRLRIHGSGAELLQDLRGTIRELNGTIVEVCDDKRKLQVDLQGADFNGDVSSPAYLVCEFRNGGRYSFCDVGSYVYSYLPPI